MAPSGEAQRSNPDPDTVDATDASKTTSQRHSDWDLIVRAGAELGRTLDLDKLFTTLRSLLAERLDCDVLYLSQFDPDTQLISCIFAWQDGHSLDTGDFPPIPLAPEGRGTQSQTIHSGRSIIIADYTTQRKTGRHS